MKIEKVKIEDIKPYANNAKRHTKKQIEQIKKSINDFGYNDPIALDENNMIIEGHGRYEALKQLDYKEIDCIRLNNLTEQQKKAYILAHNKLNMETGFNDEILVDELNSILDFNMEDFGFNINLSIDNLFKENERHRTNDTYNLSLVDIESSSNNFWQMPIIENDNYIPKELIGFNYAKTSKEKNVGIHFYLDDYQFERVWNKPEDYIDILKQYECILSPDFSLYMDMPMPMKIWNIYRSRQIGQYYQQQGIKVIPTLSWAEKETFDFCFEGIPEGSIVSISTIGVKQNKEALKIWEAGVDELVKRIKPSVILIYGGKLDYDYGDIKVVYYDNKVTERLKK
ncbi:MAG: DUF4417 domain-containing protein [Clostridia bacterium]|nr:DUF4417 domain-containing protein [Clostridia bacterium]